LILLQVVQSFLSADSILQRTIFNFLFLAIVLAAIRTLSQSRVRQLAATSLGLVAYVLSWFAEYQPSMETYSATLIIYSVVFCLLLISLIENVFSKGPINLDRIIGAVSIYFVFSLVWALVYALLESLQPGSFTLPATIVDGGNQQSLISEFIYFSNVTLTTLGYGDMVPISRPARMFATLEAMIGTLYIAIVIGRLVGLQTALRR
jgi:hypothetical protein